MKKQDTDGKDIIAGNIGVKSDEIREVMEVLYDGLTLEELKAKKKKDKSLRLDERA